MVFEREGHEIGFTGLSAGGDHANHLAGHFHIDGRPSGLSGNMTLPIIDAFENVNSVGRPRGTTSAVLIRGITTYAHFEMHHAFFNLLDEDQKPEDPAASEKALIWGAIHGFEKQIKATIDNIKKDDVRKKLSRDRKCGAEHIAQMRESIFLPAPNGGKRTVNELLNAIWFAAPRPVLEGRKTSPVWACKWGRNAICGDVEMAGIAQLLRAGG